MISYTVYSWVDTLSAEAEPVGGFPFPSTLQCLFPQLAVFTTHKRGRGRHSPGTTYHGGSLQYSIEGGYGVPSSRTYIRRYPLFQCREPYNGFWIASSTPPNNGTPQFTIVRYHLFRLPMFAPIPSEGQMACFQSKPGILSHSNDLFMITHYSTFEYDMYCTTTATFKSPHRHTVVNQLSPPNPNP